MVTRTWIGGGTNNVTRATDWNPVGTPQPGDVLQIFTGTANMIGGNLAGDTLLFGEQFDGATHSYPPTPTLNLSDGAHLSLLEFLPTGFGGTVNVKGSDTIDKIVDGPGFPVATLDINIGPHSKLTTTIETGSRQNTHIIGVDHTSLLINDGPSFIAQATIDVDVGGKGSWTLNGFMSRVEFGKGVAATQTVNMVSDSMIIDDPKAFKARINLEDHWIGAAAPGGILLKDIHADSFTYHGDMLRLSLGGKVQEELHIHNQGSEIFTLSDSSAGVLIRGSTGPEQASSGLILHS